ncbi:MULTISPECIES: hypothetical protein [unclassified Rhizobium]|uniref:hypothetical protein n=1 Tax=unclassified Rhizobium TaxID=2613769 RepID=UPI0016019144|nr:MULTISPECIES: hypothetical protein [unclassified Rhizobium]MBB1247420.1 hypothetical protein [Rhizobium sp. G21]MCV3764265.1 hypothetical protein [Rhizobium sp. TRM95796]
MTQILTVSAHTAAYAAEALRPNARVSGVSPVETATRALTPERKTAPDGKSGAPPVMSSGMTTFFLEAGEKRRQPMMTYAQAEEEYRLNGGRPEGPGATRVVTRRHKEEETEDG